LDVATNSTFTNFVPGYNNLNVGNVTSHNVTGLTCNTAYYYRIRACNTCGCTDNSNTINVTTSPGALPTAPTATAATLITTSSFRANWGASAGATFYRIDVATDAAFTNILPGYNDLNVGNVIFYNVNGLSCNTTYYYRIRACNTCGCSGNSNVISVATHGIPDPPSVSLYVAGGTADLYGSWGGSPTATTYETDAGTFFAPGNAYLGPADCGVPFTFSARACNSCGCSSWVTANLTYYGPPCP
jgi:phosphodiesterase/alkaline phosphatase D-like protein